MKNAMYLRGLRFGFLLQFSVGPVCLFVLESAQVGGFFAGLSAAAAAALVDALYILLAGSGAAALLKSGRARRAVKYFGAAVLLLFGADTLLGALGFSFFHLNMFSGVKTGSLFLRGLLLTASNPLTILFWGGVFTAEAAARPMDRRQMLLYGAGCVSSTALFLTAVAGVGSLIGSFLPAGVSLWLNILVGGFLLFFGVKLLLKKV